MIIDEVRRVLALAAQVNESELVLEHPDLEMHGDYSTNIALVKKGGRKLAEEIAARVEIGGLIEKVEVAGGGFINIWLSKNYLIDGLGGYANVEKKDHRKIMFEFGQPNTHKMPHVGHLYSYIYGESCCRLLEATGVQVRRVNYQGDVGMHVAKCMWAWARSGSDVPDGLEEKVNLLQKMYQMGSKAYEEDESAKKEINEINKAVYSGKQSGWTETRQWSVDFYQKFEHRLGITYDHYYFESQVASKGVELVERNVGQVFTESQGAIVFEGSHTRVFITAEGNPTYEAKDLALEIQKTKDWPCDLIVITTASEQNEYFKVVFEALLRIQPDLAGRLKHIGFGMINLKTGKMSSRTGNIVGGVELVEEVVKQVGNEQVGLGAVKYGFLKSNPLQNMAFELESSIATEGNSGPYLLYTYARARRVMEKSQTAKVKSQKLKEKLITTDMESELLRYLYRFAEVVQEAAERYSPNLVCNYLYELASRYNRMYNADVILGNMLREKLTEQTAEVLRKGLALLGIEAVERM